MRWGECSEDWAGACRWGGGGVLFLTEKQISAKKCSWGLKTPKKLKIIFFWGGGGGGEKFLSFFSLLNFFFSKMFLGFWNRMQTKIYFSGGGGDFGVFGAPHAPTRGSRGVGKRYTSSYDYDMWPVKILERSGLAVKSYHPETLAAEE